MVNMLCIHVIEVYLNWRNRTNQYTCIKHVLLHIISYQNVSVAFVIIIIIIIITSLALQGYSEHNQLPNCVSGTTQRYDRCLRFYMWSQNVSLCVTKYRWDVIVKNETWCIVLCSYYTPCLLHRIITRCSQQGV
jgi:hypothetical protein